MTIDVVIPSLHRKEKLDNCLNSIFRAEGLQNVTIWLYLTDEAEYQHYWKYFSFAEDKVKVMPCPNYKVPEFWNGHLEKMTADCLFCLNDDTEVHKDTFLNIEKEYTTKFPDLDGMMGITQSNALEGQGFEGAFPVIGRKFADRFPNRHAWCPDYYRLWADNELMLYAKEVNKFFFSEKCSIVHWHPAFGGRVDKTHTDVRIWLDKDRRAYKMRRFRGWLWGKDYQLLGSGNVNVKAHQPKIIGDTNVHL